LLKDKRKQQRYTIKSTKEEGSMEDKRINFRTIVKIR
jgi:hypothetical protein